MIKEALQYIVGLGNLEVHYENGQSYSTQPLHLLKEPTTNPIEVRSLSGLVEYLTSEFDTESQLMVHVSSPTEVVAFSTLNLNKNRNEYIRATALLPSFSFDRFYDAEDFNIKLQSAFVKNEDRDIMLKVVGNIREENVKTVGDDGVSQAVQAKVGVATVATVQVPNPVILKPYRTFVEVDQPESDFIFRMQNGPRAALFEADGGAWKLQAMRNIKDYLNAALEQEIVEGKVIVIA
ncbi:hypothetical protein OEV98_11120 [Caldibacillus lycopersici]|uniref:Phage protein n=1 Tax=Perspicuibacillus lycopersici TaxID=1325689 RepID=A0AAE3LNP7_9BACI|nr:hypothetical protein [Perspicuibacillus lycopersici]MCU9614111.1 hypothetical protein [Perspicuibacillus lycopersici]